MKMYLFNKKKSWYFLEKRIQLCSYPWENYLQTLYKKYIFTLIQFWFDFQVKLHSAQGQKVQHPFGWTLIGRIDLFAGVVPEAWGRAKQWLELKHRETTIPLSLSLSPSKHCNKSFISAQASDDELVSGSA